jgi:hypothetical protein
VSNNNKKIKENIGDFSGSPTFQGSPFGYGGPKQLAAPTKPPEDFERIIDDLVAQELEDISGGQPDIFTERNQADQFYRDLPGFPATNTLVAKRMFVPDDPAEKDNVDLLGPTVGGIAIKDIPGNTSNNWKATTPEKRGRQIIDINALVKDYELPESISVLGRGEWGSPWNPAQLVAKRDWQAEIEQNKDGDIKAKNPVGGMGITVRPMVFVPKSAENQINIQRESSASKEVLKPRKNIQMSTKNLVETIKKIIFEELSEAEELGTMQTSQNIIKAMEDLAIKYGGKGLEDYDRLVPQAEKDKLIRFGNASMKLSRSIHGSPVVKPQPGGPKPSGPNIQQLTARTQDLARKYQLQKQQMQNSGVVVLGTLVENILAEVLQEIIDERAKENGKNK